MPGETDPREERQARSLALEKAYVHDVYDQIAPHFTDTRYRAWPRVKQFLLDLEPASLVADVGCGNGKYLDANREVVMVGSDRCMALTEAARAKNHEVVTCDNLQLPFRDETFDAALSVAVIHHFATTDRRVAALKELARILRIGGKVLITVWAMEQRHRKFDSQDVLVPWHEPVKSSSEDRTSSVEREVTSTTTSDDDVLVYHAYSHISDSEAQRLQDGGGSAGGCPSTASRRRQKYRNGRGRYRSAGSFEHRHHHHHHHHHGVNSTGGGPNSSRSSSELSSPNETCYSFVKRALQKLSSSASNTPFPASKKSNSRPYFYRSCRKPWASNSMEFGPNLQGPDPDSPRHELYHQSSLDSECPDQPNEDDVPIELRHLEGYEPCINCGSPVLETNRMNHCQLNVCASCLPIETSDSEGKKSRSLGDFFNMIPKLLRVKKCEKDPPLSDLHKRISTASDPREYVVKSRGTQANGIVRSKSTLSFMSRLEEIMSLSITSDKADNFTSSDQGQGSDQKTRTKVPKLPSLTSSSLIGGDCSLILPESDRSTNPRRYNSPADALRKLRQDVSLDDSSDTSSDCKLKSLERNDSSVTVADDQHNKSALTVDIRKEPEQVKDIRTKLGELDKSNSGCEKSQHTRNAQGKEDESVSQESHLSSYYSMPELYKLAEEQISNDSMFAAQRQRHISFYEQAQTILRDSQSAQDSQAIRTECHEQNPCSNGDGNSGVIPLRALVKRSLSVDTGDNAASSHQCPRRFSASAAQGVLASALRTYSLPRSSSRGSSVKSDTSVDSEESIVSVIPRKNNSITSDTSVDSEESVVSVIQRSTSEIETLVRESGLRNNISRLGSRSAQASPVTVLSSQTSSAESSPPQSGKNDGKFPGSGGVIDQLMQQHQMTMHSLDGVHLRQDASDHSQRTRRFLLRPISDPKIEDRIFSSSFDESIYRATCSRQTPGSNRSSLESDDQVIKEEDEKNDSTITSPVEASSGTTTTSHCSSQGGCGRRQDAVIFSRTPSPIGPIKYIYDPLLTDLDMMDDFSDKSKRTPQAINDGSQDDSKTSDSSEREETDASIDNTAEDIKATKAEETERSSEPENDPEDLQDKCRSSAEEHPGESETEPSSENADDAPKVRPCSEAERYERLRKLSQRLENLGLSSELLRSFYTSEEDDAEEPTENQRHETPEESAQQDTEDIPSMTEDQGSRAEDHRLETNGPDASIEKSDEDSYVDESLKTVIHDVNRADDSTNKNEATTVDGNDVAMPVASKSDTVLHSENMNDESECNDTTVPTPSKDIQPDGPKNDSNCNCEQKSDANSGVRTGFKKKLKRSCVTIDEVECREVASSEDTSPSSSTSLEWNDFDKVESGDFEATSQGASAASCQAAASTSNVQLQEEGTASPPPLDVNVAEPETKFNVFLDKEICLFFETPSSSSMGKSASSSSNATDFSTTSDRIRGVMQREKSDDRSSKESDSDNLSKLSDLEAKSDSAFSEDFARKTDLASSSSSASLDVFDAHRTAKHCSDSSQQSWADYDGGSSSSKEKQGWILDNIDEIPDDERHCDVESINGDGTRSKVQRQWSDDRSLDYSQRRENFFSCAADCRDMYRMSLDDSSPNTKDDVPDTKEAEDDKGSEAGKSSEATSSAVNVESPPRVPCVQQPAAKDSDESEAPTDILAAFVETISDLTSVFGELYPRHDAKFDDVSSDDSLEPISSFERVLTSQEPKPAPAQQEAQQDSAQKTSEALDLWFPNKKTGVNNTPGTQSGHLRRPGGPSPDPSSDSDKTSDPSPKRQPPCPNGPRSFSFNDNRQNRDEPKKRTNENEPRQCLRKQDSDDSSGVSDPQKVPLSKTGKKTVEDLKLKPTPKQKLLNRSSQSVCVDRFKQDSMDADDDSTSRTQSAPCSPRLLKIQQKSVEEVMCKSKPDLSRNSSLSLSTSQESLPGNQSGGLMAYHRYYHVFRQGELDSLIDNYVDNLHIIASYYDHANWCVVAEKVQVWTI